MRNCWLTRHRHMHSLLWVLLFCWIDINIFPMDTALLLLFKLSAKNLLSVVANFSIRKVIWEPLQVAEKRHKASKVICLLGSGHPNSFLLKYGGVIFLSFSLVHCLSQSSFIIIKSIKVPGNGVYICPQCYVSRKKWSNGFFPMRFGFDGKLLLMPVHSTHSSNEICLLLFSSQYLLKFLLHLRVSFFRLFFNVAFKLDHSSFSNTLLLFSSSSWNFHLTALSWTLWLVSGDGRTLVWLWFIANSANSVVIVVKRSDKNVCFSEYVHPCISLSDSKLQSGSIPFVAVPTIGRPLLSLTHQQYPTVSWHCARCHLPSSVHFGMNIPPSGFSACRWSADSCSDLQSGSSERINKQIGIKLFLRSTKCMEQKTFRQLTSKYLILSP